MEMIMALEAAVALPMAVLAAPAIVMAALALGAVATSAMVIAMGFADHVNQDIDLLGALAPIHVMFLVLIQTGSLAVITELMQHVNLMMIMAAL
ncbi:hypothetical protein [Pseudomonas mandelii]|nr:MULTISPECIES: hypothetical protein [Pseudomonas]